MRFTIVTPSFNQLDWLELCVASVADQQGVAAIEHIVQDAGTPGIEEFARGLGADFYQDGKKVFGAQCSVDGESFGAEDTKADSAQCTSWSPRRPVPSNLGSVDGESVGADGGNLERKGYSLTIYSEKDEGMYDAINKGLLRATGDICAYLNCDEQYFPGALATVGNYFGKHAGTDVLFGDTIVAGREGEPLCYWRPYVPTLKHLVGSTLNTLTCSTFFRRSVVEAGHLFEPQWKVVGDLQWIRGLLEKQRSMAFLRAPLAAFTFLGDNLGASAKAHEEFGASREASSGLQRAMRRGWHGVRKLFSGAYVRRKVTYDLFTLSDPSRRRRYTCPSLGWKWPGLEKKR